MGQAEPLPENARTPSTMPGGLPSIPDVLEAIPVGDIVVVRFLAARLFDDHSTVIRKALAALAGVFCNMVFDFSKVEWFSTAVFGEMIRARKALLSRWQPAQRSIGIGEMLSRNFDDADSAISAIRSEKWGASLAVCGMRPALRDEFRVLT